MEDGKLTLEELEQKRREMFRKGGIFKVLRVIFTGIAVIIFIKVILDMASFALFGAADDEAAFFGSLGLALLASVFAVAAFVCKMKWDSLFFAFNKSFKDNIVLAILRDKMEVISYIPNEDMKKEEMDKSNLFRHYNIHNGNDLLEANYKNTHFRMCDTKHIYQYTTQNRDGDDVVHNIDRFFGRLFIIDYDAFCDTPVYVCEHTVDSLNKSSPYSLDDSEKTMLSTESPEFDKRFYVKCESELDALRILTPQVITGILDARKNLASYIKNVRFAFKDDKLYVTLYSEKDLMEAAQSSDVTVAEQQAAMMKEIDVITDLMDVLYLREIKGLKGN
jgi:hypothetical protein